MIRIFSFYNFYFRTFLYSKHTTMKNYILGVVSLLTIFFSNAQDEYAPGPNSQVYERIPKGTVTKYVWESDIYENTNRDYYVYVPAQYDGSTEAALMVFQDGHAYVNLEGDYKVPTVFDNLIAQGKMPVTIGLFINPGHNKDAPEPENLWEVTNRRAEYDEVSGVYGDFLLQEMIPELKKKYSISDDPKMRAVSGVSSGGICAFSVAWFHPEQFQKVMSHIGSFTDIRGGHNYPSMIRKNEPKDIKVFLQDGSNDLNNEYGNWWLANLQMESALKFSNYDYKFVPGTGGHNGNHSGAILPESLEWLWSDVVPDWVQPKVYNSTTDSSDTAIIQGETAHFKEMKLTAEELNNPSEKTLFNKDKEQIIILKEGELSVTLNGKTTVIGPNSIVLVMPGDKAVLKPTSSKAEFYQMAYVTHKPADARQGKKEGSMIVDFDALEFKPHSKGGVRNYFERETAMCSHYEMHVTSLNPGIKSHEPHTHKASEFIIMINGETEMEIGNAKYQGKAGAIYYLASETPHAIKNIGNEQCMYFAFQWED